MDYSTRSNDSRKLDEKERREKFHDLIQKAKDLLPLETLIQQLGDWDGRAECGLCPFHDDHHPSFSVFTHSSGDLWKCFSGCGAGDQINYLEVKFQIPRSEAILMFFEMAGLGNRGGGRFRK
jgi:DNA primase